MLFNLIKNLIARKGQLQVSTFSGRVTSGGPLSPYHCNKSNFFAAAVMAISSCLPSFPNFSSTPCSIIIIGISYYVPLLWPLDYSFGFKPSSLHRQVFFLKPQGGFYNHKWIMSFKTYLYSRSHHCLMKCSDCSQSPSWFLGFNLKDSAYQLSGSCCSWRLQLVLRTGNLRTENLQMLNLWA